MTIDTSFVAPCEPYFARGPVGGQLRDFGRDFWLTGVDVSLLTFSQLPGVVFLRCYRLLGVRLPAGLKGIGAQSFQAVWRLQQWDPPAQLEVIGPVAFCGTGLRSFQGGPCLEVIAPCAFEGSPLHTVDLGGCGAMSRIGRDAFALCLSLRNVALPPIGRVHCGAFAGCSVLERLSLGEGVSLHCDSFAFTYPQVVECGGAEGDGLFCRFSNLCLRGTDAAERGCLEMRVWDGCGDREEMKSRKRRLSILASGGRISFGRCQGLVQVDLRGIATEEVPKCAFEECHELERIILPATVSRFETRCFGGCLRLTRIEGLSGPVSLAEGSLRSTFALRRVPWANYVVGIREAALVASGIQELDISPVTDQVLSLIGAGALRLLRLRWSWGGYMNAGLCVRLRDMAFGRAGILDVDGVHPDVVRYEGMGACVSAELNAAFEFALVFGEIGRLAGVLTRPMLAR